ncbi:MAG: arginyltransferase [Pseudohongiellaceae bacterium]
MHPNPNTKTNTNQAASVRLFKTSTHPCSYKPDQDAATVFVDPNVPINRRLNTKLSEQGYRRSGTLLYRPDCESCNACISCRIPVAHFTPRRSHRKIIRSNSDLTMTECNNPGDLALFDLYQRYINTRHLDGDMYPATIGQYDAFIKTCPPHTRFLTFHHGDELKAVSVVDELEHGLSAVYTFYDPLDERRSLGNYVILQQIELAKSTGLTYLYLGYWVKDCPKMHYKTSFRPLELLIDGRWLLVK